jgi:hypothetical protein
MTRYFFHLRDDAGVIADPEGKEFANLVAAQDEAIEAGREIMAELVRTGKVLDGQVIEICDPLGAVMATVRLKDVVRFE